MIEMNEKGDSKHREPQRAKNCPRWLEKPEKIEKNHKPH